MPSFVGDNGGATTQGVTRSTIKVVVATYPGVTESDESLQLYADFFNSRFQFYGRKLQLEFVQVPASPLTPAQLQAEAEKMAAHKPFAVIGAPPGQFGREYIYYDALARRGIMSMELTANNLVLSDEDHLRRFAPYEWNFVPGPDVIQQHLGELICKQLRGRVASHAGPPYNTQQRKFGILYQTYTDGTPPVDLGPLRAAGASCGVTFLAQGYSGDQSQAPTVALKFREEDVTTIVVLMHGRVFVYGPQTASTGQAYYPEWIISNYIGGDYDQVGSLMPQEQAAHTFGIRSYNRPLPMPDSPWYWALKAGNPNYVNDATFHFAYYNFLLLSSGIQTAGPRLTPRAFEQGLFRTQFPNPFAGGQAPYFQATVGFGGGVHTMLQDVAPIWWGGVHRRSHDFGPVAGAYCHFGGGIRYRLGEWPTGPDQFFDESKTVCP